MEKLTRWDSAEHLKTDKQRALYLEACLRDGGDDPAFIAYAIGQIARSCGIGDMAKKVGATRQGLYAALSREGNPSFGMVLRVLREAGVEFQAVAVKANRGKHRAPRRQRPSVERTSSRTRSSAKTLVRA